MRSPSPDSSARSVASTRRPARRAARGSGPRTPAARKPLATRARIERAALDAFAAKGVDGATTRDIAKRAALSEGALYRHFASKEEIARSLFETIHARLAALVRKAGAEGATLAEQADAIVDAYCRTADEDWPLFSYHLLTTARFLPTRKGRDNPVAAAEDVIAAAMKRGELAKGDARILAAMALGVVLQTALHKAHGRLDGPLSAHADALRRGVAALLSAFAPKGRR